MPVNVVSEDTTTARSTPIFTPLTRSCVTTMPWSAARPSTSGIAAMPANVSGWLVMDIHASIHATEHNGGKDASKVRRASRKYKNRSARQAIQARGTSRFSIPSCCNSVVSSSPGASAIVCAARAGSRRLTSAFLPVKSKSLAVWSSACGACKKTSTISPRPAARSTDGSNCATGRSSNCAKGAKASAVNP